MATQNDRKNDPIRQGVGMRLQSCRIAAGFSQEDVAKRFNISDKTVSAWEKGRGDPGIYRLLELSELYGVPADSILLEDSLSPDAMKFAAEYDSLSDDAKKMLSTLWVAYIQKAVSDSDVEQKMPVTKTEREGR